ncbi:MAG: Gldg family protein [Lachnospiraceae bacterium]|nr:Gldg family protein [Lachnospiraceae bacterium]
MTAIFKKEFKSYMHSVVGFLFIAVMIFFFALYATVYNFASGIPYLSYTLSAILLLFWLAIPILSMRILAEERKQRTDQMILTAPVTVGEIVLGKFLAMAAVFMIPVFLMCAVPLYLGRYGEVPMGESYVVILAFALYGLACIAVGLFVSSITESQVIAAVLSFAILFVTYMMAGIEDLISSTGNLLTKFLSIFDFQGRFVNMASGILDLTAVVYFVSVIGLMLFLTTQSIQKRRYSVSVHNFSMGAYSSVTVCVVTALVVVINLIAVRLPERYTNIDVTSNKMYTLTEQTRDILRALDEEIDIYVIQAESSADTTIVQTLKGYADASSHIQVTYIDPVVNPQFVNKYTTGSITTDSIIVESSKRYKIISYQDLYETEFDYTTYQQNVTGYDAEGQLTSAIDYCISENMPKIYMIAGHNEYTLDAGFQTAIEKENIETETINLMNYDAVPEDAECILIHAPESDLSQDDADKIIAYLNEGGKALITTDYIGIELPNLERIVEEFGMSFQNGYAVDNDSNHYYQEPTYLLPEVGYAPETEGLTDMYTYLLAPFAQGIGITDEEAEDIIYTKLLTGSDSSLIKTNVQNAAVYTYEEGDIEGPVCIGVKAEKTVGDRDSVLYVFTSARMFMDNIDLAVSGNNKKLFSNIMSTMAEHETSVSIPAKSYQTERLIVSAQEVIFFGVAMVIVVPLALIAVGIVIWLNRRKR